MSSICKFLEENLVYRLLTRNYSITSWGNVQYIQSHDYLIVDFDQSELAMDQLEQNFDSFLVIQNGIEVSRDSFDSSQETLALQKTENSDLFQIFLVRSNEKASEAH